MLRTLTVAAELAVALAAPAGAQSLMPDQILSTLTVLPTGAPHPVPGSDGRVHLAYELRVDNPSKLFVTLDKIETVDPAGTVLGTLEGDGLRAMTTAWSGADARLPPGGTAAVFLDVTLAPDAPPPRALLSRVTATRQIQGPDGKPAPLPASVPATYSFTAAETPVGRPAVAVEPPLSGPGWVAVNGCCDSITSHRGGLIPVNGVLRVPERFAIDWVKLDDSGRIASGDGSRVEDYAYYGTEIHSVADGTVVTLYDEADTQVPNQPPAGLAPESIGGNMVVVDIGGGSFAFYAHMQRGSLRVKLGDRVTTGQVLGLLGNTGNTTAPHLHFHLMDGPSPLDADGLPFVFTRFGSRGFLANEAEMEGGGAAKVDPRDAGAHADQLPLNDEIVDFD